MSMRPCRECGKEISETAATCPHCGTTMPARAASQQWIPCEKCGSAKTQRIGAGTVFLASFIGAGCMMWIPVIGWILAPILLIIAVVAALSALLPSGRVVFQCQACKAWITRSKADLPA
jgi:predicted RNA-binding Zn-ribbon protein involved in translation (DUF1610 family)